MRHLGKAVFPVTLLKKESHVEHAQKMSADQLALVRKQLLFAAGLPADPTKIVRRTFEFAFTDRGRIINGTIIGVDFENLCYRGANNARLSLPIAVSKGPCYHCLIWEEGNEESARRWKIIYDDAPGEDGELKLL